MITQDKYSRSLIWKSRLLQGTNISHVSILVNESRNMVMFFSFSLTVYPRWTQLLETCCVDNTIFRAVVFGSMFWDCSGTERSYGSLYYAKLKDIMLVRGPAVVNWAWCSSAASNFEAAELISLLSLRLTSYGLHSGNADCVSRVELLCASVTLSHCHGIWRGRYSAIKGTTRKLNSLPCRSWKVRTWYQLCRMK